MPSLKTISAVRIARSLPSAELAINEAAIGLLTVGTEVLKARTEGGFGPLQGQSAVTKIGRATSAIFDALDQMADAHAELRGIAADEDILSYGDICPPPNTTGKADEAPLLRSVA